MALRSGAVAAALSAALTVTLTWQVAPAAAGAVPSFSCSGSLNPTEAAICSDDNLAALDRAVAAAYKNKFDGLPIESANALETVAGSLVITQQAWLAHRNACGADKLCIAKAYRFRKAALTAGSEAKDTPCRDIVGAAQAAIYVKDCIAVATETHPPCNADNACELIVSHNIFRCSELGSTAPKSCAAYRSHAR